MKKSAKPESKTTKPTVAKPESKPVTFTGTFTYNKDTKRFHAYDVKGKGFNGALYIEKNTDPMPKMITLTVISK